MKPRKTPHGGQARQTSLFCRSNSLTPEMCAKLYFSTNSRDSLPDYFSGGSSRGDLALGARPDTMKGVIAAPTQYAPPTQSSSMPRTMCSYSSQYTEMPLDGLKVTRELAIVNAEKSVQGQTGSKNRGKGSSMPLNSSSDTTTRQSYGPPDKSSASKRSGLIMPTSFIQVDPNAKFMESKTVFQRDFHDFDAETRRRGRSEPKNPTGGSHLPQGAQRFEGDTQYRRDYDKGAHNRPVANVAAAADAKAARQKYEVARQLQAIQHHRAQTYGQG